MGGEENRYSMRWMLCGPQGRSGGVRKISPYRDLIPGLPRFQRVAIPTEIVYDFYENLFWHNNAIVREQKPSLFH